MKLKISSIPDGCRSMSDELMARCLSESRRQKGFATVGKNTFPAERIKTLDGYKYFFNGQEFIPEYFMPSEYFEWRDS